MTTYNHWQTDIDEAKVLWAGLDRNDASINTINDEVLNELESLIQSVYSDGLKGLVIYSKKDKGFIAGADISHFSKFTGSNEVVSFLRHGQSVFDKLEALPIPTVAMIDGFCMGGGLELALACHYRVATDDDGTRLGLPEVFLGFHPGWGGTVRLPKLVGGFDAVSQVMLTGRGFRAKAAKKIGFIDEVVPKRQLKPAVQYILKNKPERHKPSLIQSITNVAFIRKALAKVMRRKLASKVNVAHYPAPKAIIDIWEQDGGLSEHALQVEADSIAALISKNDTAKI